MTDSWTDSNGDSLPSDWTPGGPLTPAGDWSSSCGCAPPDGPAIADSITIKGSPGSITSVQNGKSLWSLVLNDGTPAADFRIDRFDNTGALADSPMTIVRATGVVSFNDPVMLAADPVEPLEAASKEYVDAHIFPEAPMDQQTYGRDMGQWVALPTIIPDAPNTSQLFGRFNSTWALVPIQADAPSDGGTYGRANGAWNAALALTGGTITGSLTVNQVLTVNGSNSMVLNAPMSNQRAILGQTSGLTRWQLQLGDITAEGLNNVGSNFSLTAYSNTGGFLGNWLTIARADGSTMLNGPVNMNAGAAVNGTLALQGPGSFYLPGGSAGQVLTTNGSAALSWANPGVAEAPNDGQYYARRNLAWQVAPGGMTDAPNDGTAYARKSQAWAHLTHTDITDWTATLAPYALTTAVPVASSTTPLMDGTAAVGTGTTWARADHVHPVDTSRYAATNPSGYQTAAQVTAVLPVASTTTPLASGVAAVGVGTTYARADHVHPTTAMGDNRIINGDMRIDQRNGGASGTATGYTIDRWTYTGVQANKGTWQRQGPTTAGAPGFPYHFGFTSSSAYTPLATDTFFFAQQIEADMVSDFQWGTAQAQPATLSFWAYSTLTGTFSGSIGNYAGTRAYPFTYSIPVANTFTKISITIPGDTAGAWVMSGNAASMTVHFDLGSGANFRGPAGAWGSANACGANGAVNVVATNGATFNVTGVKLEIGSVATPYNRQSLAKSLADCQRYYIGTQVHILGGNGAAGVTEYFPVTFPVTMRAAPTMNTVGSGGTNYSAVSAQSIQPAVFSATVSVPAPGGYAVNFNWNASAEL